MLEKLYKKSEVWFAVMLIVLYVIGNSILLQTSKLIGIEMIYTIPFNMYLLAIMLLFIKKNNLFQYYGINGVKCKPRAVLHYIPLIMISTVNIWFGICIKMDVLHSSVYFMAMILTGIVEELIFRGFLFKAMSKDGLISAIILTSLLFGMGHIVNLFNGNSNDLIATVCQLFYAVAIGFLLVSVLLVSRSIIPCMITHSLLNALSTFSNETALNEVQIYISIALCLISAVSAFLIFRNYRVEILKKK